MLISIAGNLEVRKLSSVQTRYINSWLNTYTNGFSKHRRAGAARTTFRRLWENEGAPKLHEQIVKVPTPKPRNVTARNAEKASLIEGAAPHLRCWLLLCSDLAIRSGTAATLGPQHWDEERGELSFRTKYGNIQTVPVTHELGVMMAQCTGDGPFVAQLAGGKKAAYKNLIDDYGKLKRKLGIKRKLTPHDLRRTTARTVYRITGDLREAQQILGHSSLAMTAWYLQDEHVRVSRSTLELAKLNPRTESVQ